MHEEAVQCGYLIWKCQVAIRTSRDSLCAFFYMLHCMANMLHRSTDCMLCRRTRLFCGEADLRNQQQQYLGCWICRIVKVFLEPNAKWLESNIRSFEYSHATNFNPFFFSCWYWKVGSLGKLLTRCFMEAIKWLLNAAHGVWTIRNLQRQMSQPAL